MNAPHPDLQLTLIQVRDHAGAERQERDCVLRLCGLDPSRMNVINLVREPRIGWDDVRRADAVIIGGAGSHSVLDEHPFSVPILDLIRRIVAEEKPLFGSCFGHQLLAQALGGTVIKDEENSEIGTYDIELTDAGVEDPLLVGLPRSFGVQLGHKDRIDRMPDGMVTLASSARCAQQLVRVEGLPVYSSQFHCELNADTMRGRLEMYRGEYLSEPEEYRRFHDSLRDTPEVECLFERFLELMI